MSTEGWPGSIEADAGNSGHLLYAVDLPNDQASTALIQEGLETLAFRFDDSAVKVDQSVFNPARIWRLYGTWNRKGDDIPERPHRLARLIQVPDPLTPVALDHLKALACTRPQAEASQNGQGPRSQQPFDIERWIAEHGLDVRGPEPWKEGRKWIFPACPRNSEHRNAAAFILQFPSGGVAAGCHHNGCHGKDWHSLRDLLEPGWRERNAQRHSLGTSGVSKSQGSAEWPEPLPLPDPLPPAEPFEPKLLPAAFRPWIEDIAERMQCPPGYPAVASMIGEAAVVGRSIGIRPKRQDDWLVVSNLWGGVIGPPGVLKTPAIQEPLKPVQRLEFDAGRDYEEELKSWHADQVIASEREKVVAAEIRDALKNKNPDRAKVLAESYSRTPRKRPCAVAIW